jgi:general secretion pathway protein I
LNSERGFTLIEVMVALSIAAVTLVALMGRLGASADVQYSLASHTVMLDTAMDLLQAERFSTNPLNDERSGDVELAGVSCHWRMWTEKTEAEGFVRRNVSLKHPHEPELTMFLYRRLP